MKIQHMMNNDNQVATQIDIQQRVSDVLTRYLEEHRRRRTPERYEILRKVYELEGSFTAEQLFQQLKGTFPVTYATIYSAMELFEQLGLVVRLSFANVTSWEKSYGIPFHVYQVCMQCGKAQKVRQTELEKSLGSVHWRRFRSHTVAVCAYGLCATCQSKITRLQHSDLKRKGRADETNAPKKKRGRRVAGNDM